MNGISPRAYCDVGWMDTSRNTPGCESSGANRTTRVFGGNWAARSFSVLGRNARALALPATSWRTGADIMGDEPDDDPGCSIALPNR